MADASKRGTTRQAQLSVGYHKWVQAHEHDVVPVREQMDACVCEQRMALRYLHLHSARIDGRHQVWLCMAMCAEY